MVPGKACSLLYSFKPLVPDGLKIYWIICQPQADLTTAKAVGHFSFSSILLIALTLFQKIHKHIKPKESGSCTDQNGVHDRQLYLIFKKVQVAVHTVANGPYHFFGKPLCTHFFKHAAQRVIAKQ